MNPETIGFPVTVYATRDAGQRRLSRRLRTPADEAPVSVVGRLRPLGAIGGLQEGEREERPLC
jgi:hypothetical protein